MHTHLIFLALLLVIVTIKVKIIIKKRQGNGPVPLGSAHPGMGQGQPAGISRKPSATVSVPPVVALISSTVKPGAISRSRKPVPVGWNRP